MADLRLSTHIVGVADRAGNLRKKRTWKFTNLSSRPLDLQGYEMYFDVTSADTRLTGARDGEGNALQAGTAVIAGGRVEISCPIDVLLEPGRSYTASVEYEEPLYFRLLRNTGVRVTNEWFARYSLGGIDFEQEEPQQVTFELQIDDPRPKLLRWLKLQWLDWDTYPQASVENVSQGWLHLAWSENLRRDSKGMDIFVAYKVTWVFDKVGWLLRAAIGAIPKPWVG